MISAFVSPTRREILALIWEREAPAGQIAAAFSLSKPTISQHLAVLRQAGLVTARATGTSRRYRARQEALTGLHAALGSPGKWSNADEAPERALADAATKLVWSAPTSAPARR
jgi:DNA-binding transcriptional ArsR family regulator